MEHEYDKLSLTVTTCEDTESNVFGFGTPVTVKLKTADVLKAFGLGSFFGVLPFKVSCPCSPVLQQ